jgi:hypothetical protein
LSRLWSCFAHMVHWAGMSGPQNGAKLEEELFLRRKVFANLPRIVLPESEADNLRDGCESLTSIGSLSERFATFFHKDKVFVERCSLLFHKCVAAGRLEDAMYVYGPIRLCFPSMPDPEVDRAFQLRPATYSKLLRAAQSPEVELYKFQIFLLSRFVDRKQQTREDRVMFVLFYVTLALDDKEQLFLLFDHDSTRGMLTVKGDEVALRSAYNTITSSKRALFWPSYEWLRRLAFADRRATVYEQMAYDMAPRGMEVEVPSPCFSASPMKQCLYCGHDDAKSLQLCGLCLKATYCCVECQSRDWPRHKLECALLAQSKT